jgi:hypothetical protein
MNRLVIEPTGFTITFLFDNIKAGLINRPLYILLSF